MQTGITRARLKVLAAGACVALGAAACGGSSGHKQSGGGNTGSNLGADAAASVRQAASGTFDQQGVSLKIDLGVTTSQLQQIVAEGNAQGDASSAVHPPQAALQALANGSVTLNIHTTNGSSLSNDLSNQATSGNVAFDAALNTGTNTPIEFREIKTQAYLKADLQQLFQDVGESTARAQQFQSTLQAADAEIPGLAALGQGKWVTADLTPLLQMEKQSGSSSVQPGELQTLVKDIDQAFSQNSTSQRVGTSNGRTEYNVTVDAGAFANQALSSLKSLPGIGSQLGNDTSKLPTGQKVTVQLFEQGGKVVETDLDLNQFSHRFSFAIPLKLSFGSGSPVSAPSGATTIDLSKVAQALGSANGASSGTSPTS